MTIRNLELLDWLAQEHRPTPATVAACLRIGLPDLTELETELASTALFAREARNLQERMGPIKRPMNFTDFAATLTAVGHQVFLDEPENIADWLLILDRVKDRPRGWDWTRGSGRYLTKDAKRLDSWSSRSGPDIIQQFLDAGRGPSYARDMVDRALEHQVAPDMFGYSARITPEVFTELVEAGIRTGDELWAYELAGCTLAEAIGLSVDGVRAGVALAASRTGIDRAEWVSRLAGMFEGWFPVSSDHWSREDVDPVAQGFLGHGFTWEQIEHLHARGWGEEFNSYDRSYKFRGCSAEFFVEASNYCKVNELLAYKDALETGSSNSNRGMPPLVFGHTWATLWPIILQLVDAKVSPSGIGAYRAAGCRTVEEILEAASLGITAPVAKRLVKSFGDAPNKWSPKRIGSFPQLVRVYGEHAAV